MRSYTILFGLILAICTTVFGEEPPVEQWAARYNGPGNGTDVACWSLEVDDSGNVYVTGRSEGDGTDEDYATIKYSPDGNELWVARYNGPGNGSDQATVLAIDGSGNVYVSGESTGIDTDRDIATIKYSPDGNELWVARYNGPGGGVDCARGLTVDDSGDVYITGYSDGNETGIDYITIKYSPDGDELWVARYHQGSYDWAYDLAVNSTGNIYITGKSWGSTYYDIATIKYSPDGNELWVARYNGSADSEDCGSDLEVDDSGNVYVTGRSTNINTGRDYTTIKYSPDGNELWIAKYSYGDDSDDSASRLALDDSGNVYVTGGSRGSGSDKDYVTIKYSPDGNELWVARYDEGGSEGAIDVALDDLGSVYVTGTGGGGYVTVKYSPDGNELWAVHCSGSSYAYALAVDDLGSVYVTGTGGGDYVTVKYTQHDYCTGPIVGDLNNDCKVDFKDFAMFALHWLECNYALQEDCW